MKTLKLLLVAVLPIFAANCAPGQIFGPPVVPAQIVVSSQMSHDTLAIWVNGYEMGGRLTDANPTLNYRLGKEVLAYNQYYSSDVRYGEANVSAWSAILQKNSFTQTQTVRSDEVASFSFGIWSFPLQTTIGSDVVAYLPPPGSKADSVLVTETEQRSGPHFLVVHDSGAFVNTVRNLVGDQTELERIMTRLAQ